MTIDPSLPPITRLYQACEPLESLHPDDPRWVDFDAVRGEDNVVDSFARDIRRARADTCDRSAASLGDVSSVTRIRRYMARPPHRGLSRPGTNRTDT